MTFSVADLRRIVAKTNTVYIPPPPPVPGGKRRKARSASELSFCLTQEVDSELTRETKTPYL